MAFLGLPGEEPFRFRALKTWVVVQGRVAGIGERRLSDGFLIVRFAWLRWAKLDYCARHLSAQQAVLIGMRVLLTAGGRLLRGARLGALAATLRPIHGPLGGALQGEGVRGDLARIAFGGQAALGSGARHDGEQALHPVGGLGLAQPAL